MPRENTMIPINRLSNREWDVLKLLLQGKSNKLIAASLGISQRTVEFHLKNIYAKYQVRSRIELILKLGNTTGRTDIETLRSSTVANPGKTAENGVGFNSKMNWTTSPSSERNKAMNTNLRIILRNALTGFAPSVFLLMAIAVLLDGIRFFVQNKSWEMFINAVRNRNFWEIFILELILLTSGYIITTFVLNPKYVNHAWWRSAMAGIGAVILLVLLSIFIQPAGLALIIVASLCAGMMSGLLTLHKTSQIAGS